jgi:hypothetical protein
MFASLHRKPIDIKDDTPFQNWNPGRFILAIHPRSYEVASLDFSKFFRQAKSIYEAMTDMLHAHDHGVWKAKYYDVSQAARNWIVDR